MRFTLSDGAVIEAGSKLGEGGEGIVYEAMDRQRAIKLYHKPLTGRAADKLRAMVSLNTGLLADQAAWPELLIPGPAGAVAGFVMQKAGEPFDIHTIYSPRDRREKLPRADWRFLVHVAANLAAAFHAAHEAGVIIGDVNQGSVRVGRDGRVRLIDCDSCQITQNGRTLRCGVGVDSYTPPELQGVSLTDVDRTCDHDAFGLAVLIFQLLFMGRHPFAGSPRAAGAPTDIPAAIAARAYAYAGSAALLRPPPSAPPVDLVNAGLVQLFEQAFSGNGPRPSPLVWHQALTAFAGTLGPCSANPRHQTPSHLKACPWCAFDQAGVAFFPAAMTARAALDLNRFDPTVFEAAWNRISAVQAQIKAVSVHARPDPESASGLSPGVRRDLDQALSASPAPARVSLVTGWIRRALAVTTGITACTMLALMSPFLAVIIVLVGIGAQLLAAILPGASRQAVKEADAELQRLCEIRWRDMQMVLAQLDDKSFTSRQRKEGRRLISQIQALQAQLTDAPRQAQLGSFLAKFPLHKDSVPGIGQSRLAQLASFGIESAADIDRKAILEVPGFGPQLADRLCAWRGELMMRFRFNASTPVRASDLKRFEQDLRQPLAHFRNELAKSLRYAELQERRLVAIQGRLAAHDAAIKAAVASAVAARINRRAGRLLPYADTLAKFIADHRAP